MKKYILFLILILYVICNFFIANTIMVNNNLNKKLMYSGYVLKYTGDSQRYYFGENATYKESYNNQVVFKDTQGKKVVVDKNNFIHYDDGSISSFAKGALINLDEIETDPITYYNFSANKILKRLANNTYVAKNLDKELEFTNLIWKLSDTKYLVTGTPMKIVFSDETEQDIEDYLEIEYTDNEIVKIFNKSVRYETISTDVYLKIGEDIKINLGTKAISKNDVNEMSLGNMVIDSNDNVNIVDLEEYKEDEEGDEENQDYTGQGGNSSSISGGNVSGVGGSGVIDGNGTTTGPTGGNGGNDGDVETEVENALTVIAPKYTVTEFIVSATGLQAIVEIEDEEARLTTGTITSILNNATGQEVYGLPETGETQIRIDTASLEPDTEYTLVMRASYTIDGDEYNKNFIYKIFRTPIFGVTLEKDLFTDESLSFNLKFDSDSTVSKLDVELVEAGQIKEEIINDGNVQKIQFLELMPDTLYTVKIKNVYIGNTSNTNTYSYTFKTLKSKPEFSDGSTHGDVQVEIDKWNSQFGLSIPELKESLIETFNYQIFTEVEGVETLVYNRITTDKNIVLKIDETIQRNTDYYCKVYATFYDNEKIVEYEIANTETSFNMNSSQMPSIRFEKGSTGVVTFNTIKGSIIIDDEGNTINSKNAKVEVIYSSTTKGIDDKGTLIFEGIEEGLELPIELKELKSNETYKFSVYATYDLHDGNGERYGYIGSIMITTKEPIPMKAVWSPAENGIDISLKLESTENSDVEAQGLYSFDLALYAGQEGATKTPIATTTVQDSGLETFLATLKTMYYDNIGIVTKDTFGLTDAQVIDIQNENKYCTIVLTNAKDYVTKNESKNFENIIPIQNFSKTYLIQELALQNPTNSEDAINIQAIQKSNLKTTFNDSVVETNDYKTIDEIISNNKINNSTIVAVKVSANMSNKLLEEYKYFEYFIYNNKNEIVAKSELIEKNAETNEAPKVLFLLSNGTSKNMVEDSTQYFARGNSYYFIYYAYKDTNKQEQYPFDVDLKNYWDNNVKVEKTINKQEATVIMYPSISTSTDLSYKYKITDIDNAIYVENDGKKYFYPLYASSTETKIEIKEDVKNNEYNKVTFDLSRGDILKNYNLEIRIQESLTNEAPVAYKKLTTQKFEEIVNKFEYETKIQVNEGIYSSVIFNDLSTVNKEKITKVTLDLIDQENKIPNIIIEKSRQDLIKDNWQIRINYLDLIDKTEVSLKNKIFNIRLKIYYINGVAGYDAINENGGVTYQTINGHWLKLEGGEFLKIVNQDGTNGYPIMYNSHKYNFQAERVLVKQNGTEIGWFNYSYKGLVRNIEGEANIPIVPKVVETKEEEIGTIGIENVIPGIKPSRDLEILGTPTSVAIKIDNIYSDDTIFNPATMNIFAEIYKDNDNTGEYEYDETIGEQVIPIGREKYINNLEEGKKYYFKLYVKNGENKYYLYDLDKKDVGINYSFKTLDKVIIENVKLNFTKTSIQEGKLIINHSSSVKNGFKGFIYEICDSKGNAIQEEIKFVVNGSESISTANGKFEVDLEKYNKEKENFEVIVNANRGSFFEYDTTYKIKITPVIQKNDGNIESIGDTVTKTYSYTSKKPAMLLYAKRVQGADETTSYIEWSISVADEDFLITGDGYEYELYKNGNSNPIKEKEKITLNNNYNTINLSKEYDSDFHLENEYTLKVYYKYYTSNKNDDIQEKVQTKKLAKVENGISIGAVNWKILEDRNIKLKFYDSYELSKVKGMKCSIYDTNGKILKNTEKITDINIIDETANAEDSHKSITFNPGYTFQTSKSYIIIIQFLDENENELARFEPESPETYN